MPEVYRTSTRRPERAPGEGWSLACAACGEEAPTLAGAACASCGAAGPPPTLTLPVARPAPAVPARGAGRFLLGWAGLGVGLSVLAPALLPVYWISAFLLLIVGGASWVTWLFVDQLPHWTYNWGSQVRLQRLEVSAEGFPGARAVVLRVRLQARNLEGRRIEVTTRFRGPDGYYLAATHPKYEGEHGEVRVRCVTRPVEGWRTNLGPLVVAIPLRALALPPSRAGATLGVEVLLSTEGQLRAEHDARWTYEPAPGDFPALGPAPSEGVELLPEEDHGRRRCPLCGEDLDPPTPTESCSLCDARLHRDCWDFAGGCTTYACEGDALEGKVEG